MVVGGRKSLLYSEEQEIFLDERESKLGQYQDSWLLRKRFIGLGNITSRLGRRRPRIPVEHPPREPFVVHIHRAKPVIISEYSAPYSVITRNSSRNAFRPAIWGSFRNIQILGRWVALWDFIRFYAPSKIRRENHRAVSEPIFQ